MQNNFKRVAGRTYDQLRPLKASLNVFGYSTSSILFEIGDTKVLCSVTLQPGVPSFLKGSGQGWLNAEYAMLPTATTVRTQRDGSTQKKNGRAIEISRLIGRALRAVIDLSKFGERTITVDCDVLQADGGTRTACITAACVALDQAQQYWLKTKQVHAPFLKEMLVGVSAGVSQGQVVLDLDFSEDSTIDADFNFVITRSGNIVEVQGTSEKAPISWAQVEEIKNVALQGAQQLFTFFDDQKNNYTLDSAVVITQPLKEHSNNKTHQKKQQAPMFSLMNRAPTLTP